MDEIVVWARAQEPHADWEALTPRGSPAWSQFRLEQGGLAHEIETVASKSVTTHLSRKLGASADGVRSSHGSPSRP